MKIVAAIAVFFALAIGAEAQLRGASKPVVHNDARDLQMGMGGMGMGGMGMGGMGMGGMGMDDTEESMPSMPSDMAMADMGMGGMDDMEESMPSMPSDMATADMGMGMGGSSDEDMRVRALAEDW